MTKICTDLEQSKRLVELGIDVNTANMYWKCLNFNGNISWKYHIKRTAFPMEFFKLKDYIPAWSIDVLLELIPNWTMDKTDKINLTCNPYYHCEACYENPIDAAFETICWLKENNKI